MGMDEEMIYATVAAVAQAKAAMYKVGSGTQEAKEGAQRAGAIGADARMLAAMLVAEEREVLKDLRVQLMCEVRCVHL